MAAALAVLLDQIEQMASAEPPLFQVQTLLETADALEGTPHRRRFALAALRASSAIRHDASRYQFHAHVARLFEDLDPEEARRLCRAIPREQPAKSRCWTYIAARSANKRETFGQALSDGAYLLFGILDHMDADLLRQLMAAYPGKTANYEESAQLEKAAKKVADTNAALAAEAMALLPAARVKPKAAAAPKEVPDPVLDELKPLMDRVEREDTTDAVRSRLLRQILEKSEGIQDVTERLAHQGYATAWFAAHGEEATAGRGGAMLHKTFEVACHCEDAQCDSFEGRAECSSHIDVFAEYLYEQKIDPAVLMIRHPSLAARSLIVKLKREFLKPQ